MVTQKQIKLNSLGYTLWRRRFDASKYKWQSITLKDGIPAKVDKLAVGGILLVKDKPLPAGEKVTLLDGRIVTIAGGGLIARISAPNKMAAQTQQAPIKSPVIHFKGSTYSNEELDQVLQRAKALKESIR